MKSTATDLKDVLMLEPRVFSDARGHFFESWNLAQYRSLGIPADFVQDNVSTSLRGVLRGLHAQHPHDQGKLVSVLHGAVYDVAVDIRRNSPTRGRWVGVTLSGENRRQLFVPPGFAHGFQVLSESAVFSYKCTEYYHPECEFTIRWDDPDIGVHWPINPPVLSEKDQSGVLLVDLPGERSPSYVG
ncbi:MAG: dTDP-4-dehydrorhamnose 3,5-epimerase [bacterium]